MVERKRIPQYRGRAHREHTKDVVAKELRRMTKDLRVAQKKTGKLEEQYAKQRAKRKAAERALWHERSEAAKREMNIRLQTKLDDWTFYNGGNAELAGQEQ